MKSPSPDYCDKVYLGQVRPGLASLRSMQTPTVATGPWQQLVLVSGGGGGGEWWLPVPSPGTKTPTTSLPVSEGDLYL